MINFTGLSRRKTTKKFLEMIITDAANRPTFASVKAAKANASLQDRPIFL